jgi:hypothetical protein
MPTFRLSPCSFAWFIGNPFNAIRNSTSINGKDVARRRARILARDRRTRLKHLLAKRV